MIMELNILSYRVRKQRGQGDFVTETSKLVHKISQLQ